MHPVLGQRLIECTALVNGVAGRTVDEIFGWPDNLKFHSSITLFAWSASHPPAQNIPGHQVFEEALNKFFAGKRDQATLYRLP